MRDQDRFNNFPLWISAYPADPAIAVQEESQIVIPKRSSIALGICCLLAEADSAPINSASE
jgi:hypothetical protein